MRRFALYNLSFLLLLLLLLGIHPANGKTPDNKAGITDTIYNPFTQDTIRYCGADSLMLDAGPNYSTYTWNTSNSNQLQKVGATGQYFVTVTNASAQTFSDTVFVSFIQYDINGYTTRIEALETNYSVTDGSLMVGRVPWYDGEIQQRYEAGTYWNAPEDGLIDSISFIVQGYSSTYFPNVGITVYENEIQKGGEDINLSSSGEKTIPLQLSVQKGRLYKFEFSTGSTGTPRDTETVILSTGNLDGYKCFTNGFGPFNCANISNGVWIKLYGKLTSYNSPGNEFYSCHSDSVLIDTRPEGNYTFLWSNGENKPAIKVLPDQSEKYYVDISNDFHTCRDSAILDIFNVPFNPFAVDSIFACSSTSFPLNAKTEGYNYYNWNTGSKDTSIIANTDAWYKVYATGGRNCLATDSIYVTVLSATKKSYRFMGNGLYSDPKNWEVLGVTRPGKPPAIIGPHEAIYIDPSGVCIMDVQQTISDCSDFTIRPNAKLIMQGSLIIQK